MYATIAESIECMEILIKNGANVNLLNKDGASCVHFASGEGNVKALDILHNAKADMSVSSGAGTILHWAAGKGRAEVVEYILEKLSFDVNVSNKQGLTPIFMAAAVNNDACVHALLMHHARIDGLLSGGLNLLHICAENGLSQSVQTIVSTEEGQKLNQVSGTLQIDIYTYNYFDVVDVYSRRQSPYTFSRYVGACKYRKCT